RSQGKRCEPLTVRDEYSRYLLEVRALEDARTETVRQSFERLFERYGLPQAMRSDNGSPFASMQGLLGLSRLSVWWVALGIDLERGRPGHPQDNGAHERCIWTSAGNLRTWTIRKCAQGASAPVERLSWTGKACSSALPWLVGVLASNRSPQTAWNCGLGACCSARLTWRRAILFGRISARIKLHMISKMCNQR